MKSVLLALAATLAPAYQLNTVELRPSRENRFSLEVDKTGLYRGKTHVFVFGRYKGAVQFNEAKPESSRVQFEIESKSIVCEDTWVSDKDKVKILKVALDEMLAADKFPTISFVSERISAKSASQFEVTGTLALRGILHSTVVSVTKAGDVYEGTAVVNMKDYGLKPPTAAFGAIGTKELMTVRFRLSGR